LAGATLKATLALTRFLDWKRNGYKKKSSRPGGPLTESSLKPVFFNDDGLRAGWSALLFLVLVFVFEFSIFNLLRPWLSAGSQPTILPLSLELKVECALLAPIIAATAIMARIERQSMWSYGYKGRFRAVYFVSGLVCGFVVFSALVFVLHSAGLLVFEGRQLHGFAVWRFGLGWGLMFLMAAAFEESALRGYLQFTLKQGIGFWWAALVLSAVFGLAHLVNTGENRIGIAGVVAIGLMFCLSLWYTGSLWWAIGCHASWDWAESYFYGAADSGLRMQGHLFGVHPNGPPLWSGGTAGPEGSVLSFAVPVVLGLGMWLWWGRSGRRL
jgi:membrane protease YdiL (CAAX protease family)